MSDAAFLAAERASDRKHELWWGEAFAMAGASQRHNVIVGNIVGELRNALRERPCLVMPSDMKVHVPAKRGFVYPDASVVCGPPSSLDDAADVLVNPTLVVEVLSRSTEAFDRGEKFDGYRSIASLRDVVLVAQHEPRVEVYSRQPDGAWLLRITRADETARLPALEIDLQIAELYLKAFDVAGDVD
jgi:Uma2 family endonuclease